jgi:hypothetical protein
VFCGLWPVEQELEVSLVAVFGEVIALESNLLGKVGNEWFSFNVKWAFLYEF